MNCSMGLLWIFGPSRKIQAQTDYTSTPASLGAESAVLADGLRPGERFVSLGAHMLHEGERIRVAQQGSAR